MAKLKYQLQMYFKTIERTEIDTTSNSTFHTPEPILSNTVYTKHRQRLEHLRPNHTGKIHKL